MKTIYSRYWAEDLPKGFYHVVVEVEYYDAYEKKTVIGNVWKGCVLGPDNKCIESSLDGRPNIGSFFYSGGEQKVYKMIIATFNNIEAAKSYKEIIDRTAHYDFIDNQLIRGAKFLIESYETDYTIDVSFNDKNNEIKETPKKVNQTTDQQVVQSLISKNATKIRDLEQQLRELRLIQKGLKKQR
jgi:hypothetical protein